MDFLDPNNDCGQALLKLAANGSAILAELLRLSNHIPDVFMFDSTIKENKKNEKNQEVLMINGEAIDAATANLLYYEQKKYENILFDFSYLKNQDIYDAKIQNNIDYIDLDENFRESYMEIIERFFQVFDSIYNYYKEFKTFISNVHEGYFIDFNLEAILQNQEGKRLLIEVIYLYGVMLLLQDRLIPSIARERLVVCYIRYKGQNSSDFVNEVCKLVKSTGYSYNSKTRDDKYPLNYPVDYFSRFNIDRVLIEQLINTLKDDDVYNQLAAYPNPEHRSVALSNQASIIFVLLAFCPKILQNENAKMREIVDKHFPDNWVIPIYQGHIVELTEIWSPFPAAMKALNNNIEVENIRKISQQHFYKLGDCLRRLDKYIIEGQLQEEFVLDHVKELMNCLRDSNVTIRWIMLHRLCKNKKFKDMVDAGCNPKDIINLLLNLSKFEHQLKSMFQNLVSQKHTIWAQDKQKCFENMNEIAEYFSGNRNWGKSNIDENYANWFRNVTNIVESLDYKHSTKTGRKIQQLIQALEDVQVYDVIERSVQIKYYITETQKALHHMVRIVNVKRQILVNISYITDFAYSWLLIDDYIPIMQEEIKKEPKVVLSLKTVFLKLASIMNQSLVRIIEANSEDLRSVANYYSGELVKFVKRVLQVIPTKIFNLLERVSVILTQDVKEFEVKLSKEELKEHAQFDQRFQLAKLTHEVSVFTEGMLCLDKVLMGVIEIEPKEILIDGIRKELGKTLAHLLHEGFIFRKLPGQDDLESKLRALRDKVKGLKRSIEYIQDFLNVYGEKIWGEELSRIIEFAVEKEATALVSRKYSTSLVEAQENYFIPNFIPDNNDFTFMGRVLRHITETVTKGFYLDHLSSWYDANGNQIFGLRYVNYVQDYLGTTFLQGLDRLIVYSIVSEINKFCRFYGLQIGGGGISDDMRTKGNKVNKQFLQSIKNFDEDISENLGNLNPIYLKQYSILIKAIQPLYQTFLPSIIQIGKLQLLRKLVTKQIYFSSKVESAQYTSTLETLNYTMLHNLDEIKDNAKRTYVEREEDFLGFGNETLNQTRMLTAQQQAMRADKEKEAEQKLKFMLKDMTTALEAIGMVNPMNKVYKLTKDLDHFPLVAALISLNALLQLSYDPYIFSLVRKNKEFILDGPHFIVGLLTIFKQYHYNNYKKFILILIHFIKVSIQTGSPQSLITKTLPADAQMVLSFLEEIIKYDNNSRELITNNLGTYIFDFYKTY